MADTVTGYKIIVSSLLMLIEDNGLQYIEYEDGTDNSYTSEVVETVKKAMEAMESDQKLKGEN